MRKVGIVLAGVLVVLGLAWGLAWGTRWQNPFRAEGVARIERGMTEQQVSDLLGVPPGTWYRPETAARVPYHSVKFLVPEGAKVWAGEGDGGIVRVAVVFDEDGQVAEVRTLYEEVRSPLRYAVRRWLGP